MLNEINGQKAKESQELDDLMERLEGSWAYRIGQKGSQRVALMWDKKFVQLKAFREIPIKEKIVQKKDIFERDPLLGHFTLLKKGKAMNDLVVVGLHLASGRDLTGNHDAAMERLRDELKALIGVSG